MTAIQKEKAGALYLRPPGNLLPLAENVYEWHPQIISSTRASFPSRGRRGSESDKTAITARFQPRSSSRPAGGIKENCFAIIDVFV